METEKSNKNNTKEKIIILILIIIIILLILALILKNEEEVPVSGDVFEITIKEDNENGGIVLSDENQIFENEQEIKIFKNLSEYSKDWTITPTSNGTYTFSIKNTNDFDIKINLQLREENPYGINMKYKLRLNEEYISGTEENWINAEEVKANEISIKAGESMECELNWYWFEGDNDTQIGTDIDSYYKVFIQVDATD